MDCMIAKVTFNEYGRRSILQGIPFDESKFPDYAAVPEELKAGILATEGFCDLELSEDGKTVLSFTGRPIPQLPQPPGTSNDAVWDELDAAYQEGVDSV